MLMGIDGDATFWHSISGWLWTLLGIPLAAMWRKVENSVSKEEMKDAINAMQEANRESRDNMRKLFENAESDRLQSNTRFAAMQESLHRTHVDLLNRLNRRRGDDNGD